MKKIYSLVAVLVATFAANAQSYNLVTSSTDLVAGEEYLIAAQNTSSTHADFNKVFVMSKTQSNNNRAAIEVVDVTTLPTTIESATDYAVFELGTGTITSTNFTFFNNNITEGENGYLYAASSSSNHLRTQVTNDANGEFLITFDENNVTTITAQGTNERNTMRFNGSNTGGPIFSCYAATSNQMNVYLYKFVDGTASIKENNIEGLKIYPNPTSDLVNIVSNEIGTKNVAIYDMLGKKVLETSTEETVNVSTLTSGVYIMNITQDGKKASRKLVVK